jgi:hypothetical protein
VQTISDNTTGHTADYLHSKTATNLSKEGAADLFDEGCVEFGAYISISKAKV